MNRSCSLWFDLDTPRFILLQSPALGSEQARFHTKNTTIKESKDIDKIPLTELVGNLQTYEMGFVKFWKGGKSKNIALKVKDDEEEESSDEQNRLKAYITRKFKNSS